jgi:hypothetical protein
MGMIRNKVYIALLIVALAIATNAALNWYKTTSEVSLCEIALNPKSYDNQTVNLRGNLYCYSNGVMHLNGIECGPRSDAWATLELEALNIPPAKTQPFLENIRAVKQQGEYKMAEVRVTGRIEDLKQHCFAPQFILYVTEIEQLSEISSGKIGVEIR